MERESLPSELLEAEVAEEKIERPPSIEELAYRQCSLLKEAISLHLRLHGKPLMETRYVALTVAKKAVVSVLIELLLESFALAILSCIDIAQTWSGLMSESMKLRKVEREIQDFIKRECFILRLYHSADPDVVGAIAQEFQFTLNDDGSVSVSVPLNEGQVVAHTYESFRFKGSDASS